MTNRISDYCNHYCRTKEKDYNIVIANQELVLVEGQKISVIYMKDIPVLLHNHNSEENIYNLENDVLQRLGINVNGMGTAALVAIGFGGGFIGLFLTFALAFIEPSIGDFVFINLVPFICAVALPWYLNTKDQQANLDRKKPVFRELGKYFRDNIKVSKD